VRTVVVIAVAALSLAAAGCGGSTSSGGPKGSVEGKLGLDCGFGGCSDNDAKDKLKASDVWCRWSSSGVKLHVRLENGMNARIDVAIVPKYTIENGGDHGDSFGSDLTVPVNALGYTEAVLDAGSPEGVAAQTPIDKCEPHLEDVDISNGGLLEKLSSDSVKIVKRG
jgi:hypothetical protein